jgi:hypothetical protein
MLVDGVGVSWEVQGRLGRGLRMREERGDITDGVMVEVVEEEGNVQSTARLNDTRSRMAGKL